jgi:hypothetical protein
MARPIDPAVFDRLPLGRDPASVRRRVEAMETLLENVVRLPVLNRGVGVDAILGLVPVVGDVASAALGAWLVWEARNLGLSKWQIARMAGNVGFDTAIGLIPFVGDAADVLFRSNSRNLRLIKRHLDRYHPATVTVHQPRSS